MCATLIGLLYGDSGSNANKSFENVGFLLIGIVYLWYTTVMPGVLKCKPQTNFLLYLTFFVWFSCWHLLLWTELNFFLVPTELEIVRKETFNNWYKARTYFLANTLTTTPIHVRMTQLWFSIVYQKPITLINIRFVVQFPDHFRHNLLDNHFCIDRSTDGAKSLYSLYAGLCSIDYCGRWLGVIVRCNR